jgi:hypothetical protein
MLKIRKKEAAGRFPLRNMTQLTMLKNRKNNTKDVERTLYEKKKGTPTPKAKIQMMTLNMTNVLIRSTIRVFSKFSG